MNKRQADYMESQVNQKQFIGMRYVKTVTYMSCRIVNYISDSYVKLFVVYTKCNCKRKIMQTCVEALDIVGEMLVKELPQKMKWPFLSQYGQFLTNFPAFFTILGESPLRPSIGI